MSAPSQDAADQSACGCWSWLTAALRRRTAGRRQQTANQDTPNNTKGNWWHRFSNCLKRRAPKEELNMDANEEHGSQALVRVCINTNRNIIAGDLRHTGTNRNIRYIVSNVCMLNNISPDEFESMDGFVTLKYKNVAAYLYETEFDIATGRMQENIMNSSAQLSFIVEEDLLRHTIWKGSDRLGHHYSTMWQLSKTVPNLIETEDGFLKMNFEDQNVLLHKVKNEEIHHDCVDCLHITGEVMLAIEHLQGAPLTPDDSKQLQIFINVFTMRKIWRSAQFSH